MKRGALVLLVFAAYTIIGQDVRATNKCREALQLYHQVLSGQKQFEDLTPEQQSMVVLAHSSSLASDEKIEGYQFSLRDFESKCEVYKYSDYAGDIGCWSPEMRPVTEKCEAYFSDPLNAVFQCEDADLMIVEQACTAYMYNESYGEIHCTIAMNSLEEIPVTDHPCESSPCPGGCRHAPSLSE